jgi:hypothetical protein
MTMTSKRQCDFNFNVGDLVVVDTSDFPSKTGVITRVRWWDRFDYPDDSVEINVFIDGRIRGPFMFADLKKVGDSKNCSTSYEPCKMK